MPRKYTGAKSLEQIEQQAAAQGLEFEKEPHCLVGWMRVAIRLQARPSLDWVYYSPAAGYFFGDGFTSEMPHQGADWFDALMDFFYMDEELPA